MTGKEIYKAVKKAALDLEPGAEFVIPYRDHTGLRGLSVGDLIELGYDRVIAEEVSFALFTADFSPLERTMVLKFIIRRDVPRLSLE